MIQDVTFEKILYQQPSQLLEAATGNIAARRCNFLGLAEGLRILSLPKNSVNP